MLSPSMSSISHERLLTRPPPRSRLVNPLPAFHRFMTREVGYGSQRITVTVNRSHQENNDFCPPKFHELVS